MEIINASETVLFHQYPSEMQPQPAYVWLDCKAEKLWAAYDPEIGNGHSSDVHYGHTQSWQIDPRWSDDTVNAILAEVAPLASRVIDGYSSRVKDGNVVAAFDEDAASALDEIAEICETYREYDGE